MNLTDALKSKQPFKMPRMLDYLIVKKDPMTQIEFLHWMSDSTRCNLIPVYALLATDWILFVPPNNVLSFPNKGSA